MSRRTNAIPLALTRLIWGSIDKIDRYWSAIETFNSRQSPRLSESRVTNLLRPYLSSFPLSLSLHLVSLPYPFSVHSPSRDSILSPFTLPFPLYPSTVCIRSQKDFACPNSSQLGRYANLARSLPSGYNSRGDSILRCASPGKYRIPHPLRVGGP